MAAHTNEETLLPYQGLKYSNNSIFLSHLRTAKQGLLIQNSSFSRSAEHLAFSKTDQEQSTVVLGELEVFLERLPLQFLVILQQK